MSKWSDLKAAIASVIKPNGTQAITGSVLQNVLFNIVSSLGENYQFVGIATTSTNPGTPDGNVFYIAGEGTYTNFSNLTIDTGQIGTLKWNGAWSKQVLEIGASGGNMILEWNTDVATTRKQVLSKYRKSGVQISYEDPESGWINEQYIGTKFTDAEWEKNSNWMKIANQKQISNLEASTELLDDKLSDFTKETSSDEEENICVQTDEGEEIIEIKKDGLFAKNLFYKNKKGEYVNVKDIQLDDIAKETIEEEDEEIFVVDSDNNIIARLSKKGLSAFDFIDMASNKSLLKNKLNNTWSGLTWAQYGDSFTHMFCNGDFSAPYEIKYNTGWGILVANALNFANYKGRGISGSSIQWANRRPKIGLVDTSTGVLLSTQESTYEDFNNVPEGQTKVRDIGCSWSRITGMFPESIKDDIDVVTIFLHNDFIKIADESEWVVGDKTDIEWGESSYYSTYGGDYNIETWRGSILSLIMKFQAWMPNAKLILCTPASGSISYGEENKIYPDRAYEGSQFEKSEIMRDVAKRLSIPLIDINAECGINMLNRTSYLQDYIHPNSANGQKMIAEPFIGGFNRIVKL